MLAKIFWSIVCLVALGQFMNWLYPPGEGPPVKPAVEAQASPAKPRATVKQQTSADSNTESQLRNMERQLAILEAQPCKTSLAFWRLMGKWHVGCSECGYIPADTIYPKFLIDAIDSHAVNGKITVTKFLQNVGQCPR